MGIRTTCRALTACLLVTALTLCMAAAGRAANVDDKTALTKEKAALSELQSILNVKTRPRSREEAAKLYATLTPKLVVFADKYPKTQAGAQGLLIVAQMFMMLEQETEAETSLNKFIERQPTHKSLPDAKYLLAMVKHQTGDYAAAKKLLTDHIKQHPDYRGRAQVDRLLEKIAIIGTEAKDFKTPDLAGKDVQLNALRGKIVLLDFYAGWCAPCKVEMPNLIKLYAKYHDKGFEIIGISLDRSKEKAKEYVKDAGITWTATWEEPGFWHSPVAKLYEVRSIPAMYLLDKEGKILHVGLRGERLAKTLEKLFADAEKE